MKLTVMLGFQCDAVQLTIDYAVYAATLRTSHHVALAAVSDLKLLGCRFLASQGIACSY